MKYVDVISLFITTFVRFVNQDIFYFCATFIDNLYIIGIVILIFIRPTMKAYC